MDGNEPQRPSRLVAQKRNTDGWQQTTEAFSPWGTEKEHGCPGHRHRRAYNGVAVVGNRALSKD